MTHNLSFCYHADMATKGLGLFYGKPRVKVRVTVRTRPRLRLRLGLGLMLGLRLRLGLESAKVEVLRL
jgi:hypothetical protein